MSYLLSLNLPEEPYFTLASAKYNVNSLESTQGLFAKRSKKKSQVYLKIQTERGLEVTYASNNSQ